ncbi:MAG: hypothetical protein VKJ04_10350 [Vampirovibrionales bacterium]|nr:hypothetical protein [Vampirovibrionales bacterium]
MLPPTSPTPAVVNVTVTDPKTLMGDIVDSAMDQLSQTTGGGKGSPKQHKGNDIDPQANAIDKLKRAIDAQAAAQKAQIDYMWANKQVEEAAGKAGQSQAQGAPQGPGNPEPAPKLDEQNPFRTPASPPPSFLPGQAPPVQIPAQGPKQ